MDASPDDNSQPRGLKRSMKVLGALFLTLSAATPASSVFVVVPDVLSQAGTGAVIAMIIAALIAVCVAQVYAELGSAFPLAGGEYAMVGRTLGPGPGYVLLGLNLANSLLAAGALALGVAPYLASAGISLPPVAVALAAVVGATLLGVLNIRTNALITGAFVAVELLSLLVVAVLGFTHVQRPLAGVLTHPAAIVHGANVTATAPMIGLAVAVAVFAYDGYGSAVYFGEELHSARREIGRAIIWALGLTVAAELIPVTAAVLGAPDLPHLLTSDQGLADFVGVVGGPTLRRVLSLGVALAILNAVIAMVLLTARQIFASARDEAWPFNGAMTRVHPTFHSPWVATLIAGTMACGLCLVPMKLLLIATGTGAAAIYAVLCVAVMAGRRSRSTAHGHYRMPLYPVAPVLALIAIAGVLWADWLDPDEGRPGLFIALGVAAVFGGYYWLVARRLGRFTLREGETEIR